MLACVEVVGLGGPEAGPAVSRDARPEAGGTGCVRRRMRSLFLDTSADFCLHRREWGRNADPGKGRMRGWERRVWEVLAWGWTLKSLEGRTWPEAREKGTKSESCSGRATCGVMRESSGRSRRRTGR